MCLSFFHTLHKHVKLLVILCSRNLAVWECEYERLSCNRNQSEPDLLWLSNVSFRDADEHESQYDQVEKNIRNISILYG